MPYQELQFFVEDGVSLTGWYIPQSSGGKPSQRVIVCCHPHNSSKSNLLGVARGLWERKYSVFMFDFRSFARTPGRQSVGFLEQRDARAAVACARKAAPEGARIGLVGASMGGAVALMVGHESEVDAVGIATDCAFASLTELLRERVRTTLHLPDAVAEGIVRIGGALNPLLYGYPFSDVSPATSVASGPRAGDVPLLVIHAENDEIVPVTHAHMIHSAAAVPAELKHLMIVQHCHHVGCFFLDRTGYVKVLTDFFGRAFARAEEESSSKASPSSAKEESVPSEGLQ